MLVGTQDSSEVYAGDINLATSVSMEVRSQKVILRYVSETDPHIISCTITERQAHIDIIVQGCMGDRLTQMKLYSGV